ncbi:hypothetical protein NSK_001877 [Nannochloropsis salina CCMP1776]|uniref:VTT domain-containing protein n=1 Tax=Nannochloropsis salina CCMP1776 TaxID=1027361 RepID=A0A4D9DDU1_9STRA|nr:hypothetical protein NSK_001877 [Nannochloropsis salina CCMP1776]|eukprot:TFJ86789.1 hypothetical protein NSK_001877 [Nannochloropsis salina CCMP1776]
MASAGSQHSPSDYARLETGHGCGADRNHQVLKARGGADEEEDEVEILFASPATPTDDQGRASAFLVSSSSPSSSPPAPHATALPSLRTLLRPLGAIFTLSSSSASGCRHGGARGAGGSLHLPPSGGSPPSRFLRRMRTSSSHEHAQGQGRTSSSSSSFSSSSSSPQPPTASGAFVSPRFHSHAPPWVQVTYFLLLGCLFLAALVDSFTSRHLYHLLEHLFAWVEEHQILGPLVFWSAVVVFSVVCVPESALTVGGGYIFAKAHGVGWGILLCTFLMMAGGVVGSVIAFLVARYLAFDTVQRWARRHRLLRALDLSLVENGAKMVFLLRLSPFLPAPPLSYLLGTTSVKLSDFVLGSTGMLPWVVTCSYLGSALRGVADVAGKGRRGQSKWAYALYALGAVGTMGVVAAIGIYTRRAMEEILREEPSEGEERKEAEDRGRREDEVHTEMNAVLRVEDSGEEEQGMEGREGGGGRQTEEGEEGKEDVATEKKAGGDGGVEGTSSFVGPCSGGRGCGDAAVV